MEDIGLISSVGNAMAAESFIFWKQIIDIIQCHLTGDLSLEIRLSKISLTSEEYVFWMNYYSESWRDWILDTITLSHCHTVTLSHCHTVILSYTVKPNQSIEQCPACRQNHTRVKRSTKQGFVWFQSPSAGEIWNKLYSSVLVHLFMGGKTGNVLVQMTERYSNYDIAIFSI